MRYVKQLLIISLIAFSSISYGILVGNQIQYQSDIYADDINYRFAEIQNVLNQKGFSSFKFKNAIGNNQECSNVLDLSDCRVVEVDDEVSDTHIEIQLRRLITEIPNITATSDQFELGDYIDLSDLQNPINLGDISSQDINDAFDIALSNVQSLVFEPSVASIPIGNTLKIRNSPSYNDDEDNVVSYGYGSYANELFKGNIPTETESIYMFGGESGYSTCTALEVKNTDLRQSDGVIFYRAKNKDGGLASDDVEIGKTENRFGSGTLPAFDFKQNFYNNDKTAVDGWEFGSPNRSNKKVYFIKAPAGTSPDCSKPISEILYFTLDYKQGKPVSSIAEGTLQINTNLKMPASSAIIDISSVGSLNDDGGYVVFQSESPLQGFDQYGNCTVSISDWNNIQSQGGWANLQISYRNDSNFAWYIDNPCTVDLTFPTAPKFTIYQNYEFYSPNAFYGDTFGYTVTKINSTMYDHYNTLLSIDPYMIGADIQEDGTLISSTGEVYTGGTFEHLGAVYLNIVENNDTSVASGALTLPLHTYSRDDGNGFEDNIMSGAYIDLFDNTFGGLFPDGNSSLYLYGEDQYGACSPVELSENDIYVPTGGGYANQKTFVIRVLDKAGQEEDLNFPVTIQKTEGRFIGGTIASFDFYQNFYNDDGTRALGWDNPNNRIKKIYYQFGPRGVNPPCDKSIAELPFLELSYEGGLEFDYIKADVGIDLNLRTSTPSVVDLVMNNEIVDDGTDKIIIEHRGPFQGFDQWGFCEVDINTWNNINKNNLTVKYNEAYWPIPTSRTWDAYCEIDTQDINNPVLNLFHNYEYYTYDLNAEFFRSAKFQILISRINSGFSTAAELARNNPYCFNLGENSVDLTICDEEDPNDGAFVASYPVEFNTLKGLSVNVTDGTLPELSVQDLWLQLDYSYITLDSGIPVALNLDSQDPPSADIGAVLIDADFPLDSNTNSPSIPGNDPDFSAVGYNGEVTLRLNQGSTCSSYTDQTTCENPNIDASCSWNDIGSGFACYDSFDTVFSNSNVDHIGFYSSTSSFANGWTCDIQDVNTTGGSILQNDISTLTRNTLGNTIKVNIVNRAANTVDNDWNYEPYCRIQPRRYGENPQEPVLFIEASLPNDLVVTDFIKELILVGFDSSGNPITSQKFYLNLNRSTGDNILRMDDFTVENFDGQYYFVIEHGQLSINNVGIDWDVYRYWDNNLQQDIETTQKQFQDGSISAPRLRRVSNGTIDGNYNDYFHQSVNPHPTGRNIFAFPVSAFVAGENYYWETTDYTFKTHTSSSFSVSNCTINDVSASSLDNGTLTGFNISGNTNSCSFTCNNGYIYNETNGICEIAIGDCTLADAQANGVDTGGVATIIGQVNGTDVSQCLIGTCSDPSREVSADKKSCDPILCETIADLQEIENFTDTSNVNESTISGDYYGCNYECNSGYTKTTSGSSSACQQDAPSNITMNTPNLFTSNLTNIPITIGGNGDVNEVKLWSGSSTCGGTLVSDWTVNKTINVNLYSQNGVNIYSAKARNTNLIESECQALLITHDNINPIVTITNQIDDLDGSTFGTPLTILQYSINETNHNLVNAYNGSQLLGSYGNTTGSVNFNLLYGTNILKIEAVDKAGLKGEATRTVIVEPAVDSVTKISPTADSGEDSNLTIRVSKMSGSGVKLYSNSNCTSLLATSTEDSLPSVDVSIDLGINYGLNTIYATQYRGSEESACSTSFVSYTLTEPVPDYQSTDLYGTISNVKTSNLVYDDGVHHATLDGVYVATVKKSLNEINIYKDNGGGSYSLNQSLNSTDIDLSFASGDSQFDLFMEEDYMAIAKCNQSRESSPGSGQFIPNGEVVIYKRNTQGTYQQTQVIAYDVTFQSDLFGGAPIRYEAGSIFNTQCVAKIHMNKDLLVFAVGSTRGELRVYKRNSSGTYNEKYSNNWLQASWYFSGGIDTAGDYVYATNAFALGTFGLYIDDYAVYAREPDGSLLVYYDDGSSYGGTNGNGTEIMDIATFSKSLFSLKSSSNKISPICCGRTDLNNKYISYVMYNESNTRYESPFGFDPISGLPINYKTDATSTTIGNNVTNYGGYAIFNNPNPSSTDNIYIYYYNPNENKYELKEDLSSNLKQSNNKFLSRGKFLYLFDKDSIDENLYIYKINDVAP